MKKALALIAVLAVPSIAAVVAAQTAGDPKDIVELELLTHTELLTVLHRQGFSGLDEVEQCVLEPGGTFAVKRKEPPQSDIQYAELIRRLEGIDARLAALTPAKG